jgi:hypothetical protein
MREGRKGDRVKTHIRVGDGILSLDSVGLEKERERERPSDP